MVVVESIVEVVVGAAKREEAFDGAPGDRVQHNGRREEWPQAMEASRNLVGHKVAGMELGEDVEVQSCKALAASAL